MAFSSIDTVGKFAVAHPVIVGGVVVTVAIVGSTLYYFDRVHKREMDQIYRLMDTGKFVVSCVSKYVSFVALNTTLSSSARD